MVILRIFQITVPLFETLVTEMRKARDRNGNTKTYRCWVRQVAFRVNGIVDDSETVRAEIFVLV